MKSVALLSRAFLGGVMIGIGGTTYLFTPEPMLGAFLFAVGLFAICAFRFALYTGETGYLLDGKVSENGGKLALIWLGNFAGCVAVALLIRWSGRLAELAAVSVAVKLSRPLWHGFCTAILCGALMYVAVDNFRNNDAVLGKYLGMILCVPAFIISGFEHCIADMFFFAAAQGFGIFSGETLVFLLVMTAGNLVGGLAFAKIRALGVVEKTSVK